LFEPKTKVLDIGTGGGLPGIPLAIFFPKTIFHLVDRKQKKIDVLRNIIIELDIKNVVVERIDAQDISNEYDFILNRAVSSTENILSISRNKIKTNSFNKIQNGIICLKGGNLENETVKLKNFEILNLNKIFSESFFETKKILYIPNPYTHMDNQ
jgi:16S rRNA (guanine527-N7)-methyltransferase